MNRKSFTKSSIPVAIKTNKPLILKVRKGTPKSQVEKLVNEASASNFRVDWIDPNYLRPRAGSVSDLHITTPKKLEYTETKIRHNSFTNNLDKSILAEPLDVSKSTSELETYILDEPVFNIEITPLEPELIQKIDKMTHEAGSMLTSTSLQFKMNPGQFTGKSEEDIEEFLTRYSRACRVNNWNTDEEKAQFLPIFLTGAAVIWLDNFEATNNEDCKKFSTLKPHLKAAFEPRIPTDRAEFKLRTRTQGKDESLESYYQDVLRLCRQVNEQMADADKARHLLHGLSRDIIKDVMLLKNDTAQEVLQNARKVEIARSYLTTNETAQSELLKKSADEITKLNQKLSELTVMVKEGNRSSDEQRRRINQMDETNRARYNRNINRDSYGRTPRTFNGRPICYNCSRPGHIARDCVRNRRTNPPGYNPNWRNRYQRSNENRRVHFSDAAAATSQQENQQQQ